MKNGTIDVITARRVLARELKDMMKDFNFYLNAVNRSSEISVQANKELIQERAEATYQVLRYAYLIGGVVDDKERVALGRWVIARRDQYLDRI